MDQQQRSNEILVVTRRLLIFAFASLVATVVIFGGTLVYGKNLLISWLCFECGIIGGFVSIQQRLPRVVDEELSLLAKSWYSILLVPIYGGIFSLVLYVIFLSNLVEGALFPDFYVPEFAASPSDEDISALLSETLPKSGPDFAKLIFWCFVAGFSERFVPQIIQRVADTAQSGAAGGTPGGGREASDDAPTQPPGH